jgi:beta-N-acetylhexosaminidase
MRRGGIAICIKHFPGLGRVTGNTDFTADGTVDEQFSGVDDPYLLPFQAGIDAGAEFVMMSLAIYPRVDRREAAFSSVLMQDILRDALGFESVIVTDDVGAAEAVAYLSPAERAVDFLRAGGDMVLTVQPSDIALMTDAVLSEMQADPDFAARVDASVERILRVKSWFGLLAEVPVT